VSEVKGASKLLMRPANDAMPIAWLLYANGITRFTTWLRLHGRVWSL